MPAKIELIEEQVIERYNSLKSLRGVAKYFNVSIRPVSRILRKHNIIRNSSRKYYCDQNFFEAINTEEKAYFLGYLYADGYVRERKRSSEVRLKLHRQDKAIIEEFNRTIKGNYPITDEKNTNCVKITIGSKKMVGDLIKVGCVQAKSLILTFPHWLEEGLLNHFIRGYFDGDGSISMTHGNPNEPRINFVSSHSFIISLRGILSKKCGLSKVRIMPQGRAYELPYAGRLQVMRVYQFLYHRATVFLKRKKDRFELCDLSRPFIDRTFCGDCLDLLKALPRHSVDLVLTSPPYNLSKDYDLYKDKKKYQDYLLWLTAVFKEIYRSLKDGGRCVIILGDHGNGRVPVHSDVLQLMKNLRYMNMGTIIWDKEHVSNRQGWGSFCSPSAPSFPTPFEYILVFAKKSRKLLVRGETDLTKEEFIKGSLALWTFPIRAYAESGAMIESQEHPAPFPLILAERCIKMLSWVGATVLDPFMGTGTTIVACKKLGRHYMGFDLSPEYCKTAETRLEAASFLNSSTGNYKRSQKKGLVMGSLFDDEDTGVVSSSLKNRLGENQPISIFDEPLLEK